MDVDPLTRMSSAGDIIQYVADFAERARRSLLTMQKAPSYNVNGQLVDNHLATGQDGERYVPEGTSRSEVVFRKDLSPDFLLVIKHPWIFTALALKLVPPLPIVAVVRNPLYVLASWQDVPEGSFPIRAGRVPVAEEADMELRNSLSGIGTPLERQLAILNWAFGRYATCPGLRVVEYERIVATHGRALFSALSVQASGVSPLSSTNLPRRYPRVDLERLADSLVRSEGTFWRYYRRNARLLLRGGTAALAESPWRYWWRTLRSVVTT